MLNGPPPAVRAGDCGRASAHLAEERISIDMQHNLLRHGRLMEEERPARPHTRSCVWRLELTAPRSTGSMRPQTRAGCAS
jgi:hypothetical protein